MQPSLLLSARPTKDQSMQQEFKIMGHHHHLFIQSFMLIAMMMMMLLLLTFKEFRSG